MKAPVASMKHCLRFSTHRRDPISWAIRVRTDWGRSHVEFEREDGWTLGARFSVRGKLSRTFKLPFWKDLDGVQWRPPAQGAQVNVAKYTFEYIELAVEWMDKNLLGRPYDVLGCAGIILATDWHSPYKQFCSAAIQRSAAARGIYFQSRYETAPWQLTPRDIEISNVLRAA